jgi:nucleotide-binding universal stress UspA family protein
MYKRILLAYDGSAEGRTALREGALLAQLCGAQVFLLSVVVETGGLMMAEGAYPGASAQVEDAFTSVLNEGVARLKQLGFDPVAKLVRGDPAAEIGNFASQIEADSCRCWASPTECVHALVVRPERCLPDRSYPS